MNTIITISVIIVAIGILIGIAFFIATMIQVRKTARLAEQLLVKLNDDISLVTRIVSNISFFTQKLSSPWLKFGAVASGIASMFFKQCKKD